mgnify:CR=1 FL=1
MEEKKYLKLYNKVGYGGGGVCATKGDWVAVTLLPIWYME